LGHCCVGLGYYSDWALKPVQSRLRSSAVDLLPDPEHAGPMKARGPCGGSKSSVRPKSRVAQPSLTTGGYCSAAPLVPTGLPRQRGSTRRTQSGTGRLRAAPDATTSPGRHRTTTIHQGGTGRNHFSTSGTGRQLFTRAAPDATTSPGRHRPTTTSAPAAPDANYSPRVNSDSTVFSRSQLTAATATMAMEGNAVPACADDTR